MTVRVFEIHPASTIVSINFASVVLAWVSPILNSPTADASEDLIEVVFAYQESIVLGGNFAFLLIEVEGDAVVEVDDQHWSESCGRRQAQDICEKCCRCLLVAAPDDRMVKLHAHVACPFCKPFFSAPVI
jgi:hypothetical protein